MRAAYLTRDPAEAASARVRVTQYLPRFRAAGVETRMLHWQVSRRLDVARFGVDALRLARWADVVVLQKPRMPTRLLDAMARVNPRIIVDVDDAVWASRKVDREGAPISRDLTDRFRAAVDRSRAVVAGSGYLETELRRVHPGATTVVIPSSVEIARFASPARPVGAADAMPVIGWIGTPGNLVDFDDEVVAVLDRFVRERRARFVVMSSQPLRRNGFESEFVPWVLEDEAAVLASFDIGVMPLGDDERTRGRCSYKAVQYLAAGAATVASPVGSAPEVVRDGETGLLARTGREWEGALGGLLDDAFERARLGSAGRALVETDYCVEVNAPRWLDLLDRVAAS